MILSFGQLYIRTGAATSVTTTGNFVVDPFPYRRTPAARGFFIGVPRRQRGQATCHPVPRVLFFKQHIFFNRRPRSLIRKVNIKRGHGRRPFTIISSMNMPCDTFPTCPITSMVMIRRRTRTIPMNQHRRFITVIRRRLIRKATVFIGRFLRVTKGRSQPLHVNARVSRVDSQVPYVRVLRRQFRIFITCRSILGLLIRHTRLPFTTTTNMMTLLILTRLIFHLISRVQGVLTIVKFNRTRKRLTAIVGRLLARVSRLSNTLHRQVNRASSRRLITTSTMSVVITRVNTHHIHGLTRRRITSNVARVVVSLVRTGRVRMRRHRQLIVNNLSRFRVVIRDITIRRPHR